MFWDASADPVIMMGAASHAKKTLLRGAAQPQRTVSRYSVRLGIPFVNYKSTPTVRS